ncbi:MAG: menaquinone biosynthesis protein [Candidatus Sumerlaeia bacterium]|nr:menaquinone biosynthesis protein [Candidatus Sumerlaeia bacterium]
MSLSRVRLGIVPYTNVLPLLEGLEVAVPRERWIAATPRELAGLLAAGEIDAATLPVFEALRAGYDLAYGCAIACDGPVRSVQIFSKVQLSEVRHLLLDRSSLTSVHLAQVLLADHWRADPRLETSAAPLDRAFDWRSHPADAFLAIGDTALAWEHAFPHAYDLGAEWRALTGLPFVFAGWALRPGDPRAEALAAAFLAARRRGEAAASAIARREATAAGFDAASLEHYLTQAIRYRLGATELAAIDEYRRRLAALGFLDDHCATPRLIGRPAPEPAAP